MLEPISPDSSEYDFDDSVIRHLIDRIKDGQGFWEIPCSADGDYQKVSHFILSYFIGYIEKGQYPHPALLEFLAGVFTRCLGGESFDKSIGVCTPPNRPPDKALRSQQVLQTHVALSIWSLVKFKGLKTIVAIRKAAHEFNVSEREAQRMYYAELPSRRRRNRTNSAQDG